MKYKNIVVAGAGVLGSQIAFQAAYCNFNVTVLVREADNKEEIKSIILPLSDEYQVTQENKDILFALLDSPNGI